MKIIIETDDISLDSIDLFGDVWRVISHVGSDIRHINKNNIPTNGEIFNSNDIYDPWFNFTISLE